MEFDLTELKNELEETKRNIELKYGITSDQNDRCAGPRETESARVIKVIETVSFVGKGSPDDRCRLVTQFWDFEGNLLAYGISNKT